MAAGNGAGNSTSPVPSPIAGESTQPYRRPPRRDSLAKRISIFVMVASLTAGVVIWATNELASKADAHVVEEVIRRVNAIEPKVAAADRDLDWIKADTAWIKQVLWQLARDRALVVPPPPSQLTPIAAPEAP